MKLLIVGNQFDGCKYYGPFPDNYAAIAYAEKERDEAHWWVGDLGYVPGSVSFEIEQLRETLSEIHACAVDGGNSWGELISRVKALSARATLAAESAIVIVGDPIKGFGYFGPFKDEDAAWEWANGTDYVNRWVAQMLSPDA